MNANDKSCLSYPYPFCLAELICFEAIQRRTSICNAGGPNWECKNWSSPAKIGSHKKPWFQETNCRACLSIRSPMPERMKRTCKTPPSFSTPDHIHMNLCLWIENSFTGSVCSLHTVVSVPYDMKSLHDQFPEYDFGNSEKIFGPQDLLERRTFSRNYVCL